MHWESKPAIIIIKPSTPVIINVRRERKLNEETISVPAFLLNQLFILPNLKNKRHEKTKPHNPNIWESKANNTIKISILLHSIIRNK